MTMRVHSGYLPRAISIGEYKGSKLQEKLWQPSMPLNTVNDYASYFNLEAECQRVLGKYMVHGHVLVHWPCQATKADL